MNFNGAFVGMNFYDGKEAFFLRRRKIVEILKREIDRRKRRYFFHDSAAIWVGIYLFLRTCIDKVCWSTAGPWAYFMVWELILFFGKCPSHTGAMVDLM